MTAEKSKTDGEDAPEITEEQIRELGTRLEKAKKPKYSVEFEADITEIGLIGVILHVRDEHKLWEMNRNIPIGHKVKVILEKQ